jgi:hypothetical protein
MTKSNNGKYLILAVLISLALHVLVLIRADLIMITSSALATVKNTVQKTTEMIYNPSPVKIVQLSPDDSKDPQTGTASEIQAFLKRQQQDAKVEAVLMEKGIIPKPRIKIAAPRIKTNDGRIDAKIATAPLTEILSVNASMFSEKDLALLNPVDPSNRRVAMGKVPSLVSPGDLQAGRNTEISRRIGTSFGGPGGFNPGSGPGAVPTWDPGDNNPGGGTGVTGGGVHLPTGLDTGTDLGGTPTTMDDVVGIGMVNFPQPDGSGYYRIDMTPTPRIDRLRAIRKDVVFLVDCSTSISPSKLKQFKMAVTEAVEYLNPDDRVNAITFAAQPNPLFPSCQPMTSENKKKILDFIGDAPHGGMTDVFAGLSKPVSQGAEDLERPMLVFLLSDGVSTVSNRLANERFLQEVIRLNRNNVAIYSFSAGSARNINKFLLDFLAYHNRGQSRHEVAEDKFNRSLVRFVTTHTELVVADLKYAALNDMGSEIFPKRLPHLFRGEVLSIWGYYPPGAKEVVLSITGRDAGGSPLELMFRKSFAEAERGDEQLVNRWIFQKLSHLKGQSILDSEKSAAYEKEIRQMAERFKITKDKMPF